ncbi:histidinol dehydrogenase [Ruminiclostridium papyrosolvens DSM 2782]|uniref:Histidinol dehydrogenase n=1 Tax=Ruminiclostridium papyrosolvens DSM 2782 TaxID=588581 RepID=F1TE22_9FIRM|nr:histidinol dehydrogenase [Ruminiclostridium papyrosolvens]EGD47468.1 histidinol dehydrogenase [Ruminiclostridium papyrosolvens DSM 2782]WES34813.1 histidinol dehydrogenase [Ruminiclostridium papyrosolvens DSM 2782]
MLNIVDLRNDFDGSIKKDLYKKLTQRTGTQNGTNTISIVAEIIDNVKQNGDSALKEYTKKFDKAQIETIKVSEEDITAAYKEVAPELLETIKKSKQNIWSFHEKQLQNSWISPKEDGTMLGQLVRPLEKVGLYVPGGTAPLISSVLMTAVPAKVAGVEKLIMCTPPSQDGSINPAILVAAREAGVDEVYRAGGAQAVAAMAYGTETIPSVDKICGPGNVYVATAKRLVFGDCDIDMFAGPSEILVIADSSAVPEYVAADLLSQAEHDILASSVLVTDDVSLLDSVKTEIEKQLLGLKRNEIIEKSLKSYGFGILVDNLEEAIEVSNNIAPEHLELCIKEPMSILGMIKNAGAIFVGNYSPEPLGDYMAGPSHVLPTSGTARFSSPVNVDQFIKKSSLIYYNKQSLEATNNDIVRFAEAELLDAHANAIKVRFNK